MLFVCAWGALGAFAYHVDSGGAVFEAAAKVDRVIESVGAGDTFIAACIHALAIRLQLGTPSTAPSDQPAKAPTALDARHALRFACDVAADKISQVGFDGLGLRHGLTSARLGRDT